jgi:competence protein ComEC
VRAGFIEYFAGVADRVSLAAGVPGQTRLSAALQALSGNLSREQDLWFPWAVVAFGIGIATYFAVPNEPFATVAIVATAGAVLCLSGRRYISSVPLSFLMLLVAFGALGLADAKLRTRIVQAPVITEEIGPVRVTGRVEDVDVRAADRARVILSVSKIDGHTAHPVFARLTVSARARCRV